MKNSVAVKWFVCLHKSFPSNLHTLIQATCTEAFFRGIVGGTSIFHYEAKSWLLTVVL